MPTDVVVPQAATTTPSGTASAPAAQTTLRLGTAGGKSDVLVDQNGCALYLNTQDTSERTDTQAAAESTWIPVPAPAHVSGAGLDQSKVGSFTRPGGMSQATYDGHQLYRFAGDRAPGQANGQGVDGKYFLVGQNGQPVR
jgi:predicted lipoprotein with Yx(FWY)xxD motif